MAIRSFQLSKAEVARRQLGAALAMFIEDQDPVSVHSLACSGAEIAEHLAEVAGKTSFAQHAVASNPEMTLGKIRQIRTKYWNAFKHGKTLTNVAREDDDLLTEFSDDINEHTLFLGWIDYALGLGTMPIEAQVYQAWYFAKHPEKHSLKTINIGPPMFPGILEKDPIDQKVALRDVIAWAFTRQDLIQDPKTDNRPLILW